MVHEIDLGFLVLLMIRLIQNFQIRKQKKRQLADRMNIFASTVHRKNNRRRNRPRKNGNLADPEYVRNINNYLKLHQLAEYYSPKFSENGKCKKCEILVHKVKIVAIRNTRILGAHATSCGGFSMSNAR